MKLRSFGRIFSLIAMLTIVIALSMAVTVTANAAEPGSDEITIQAADFTKCGDITFTWNAISGARYCVYVNNVHTVVSNVPSYSATFKLGTEVTIFVDAIDADGNTLATGSFKYTPDHAWVETSRTEPTCTKKGTVYYECSLCTTGSPVKKSESLNINPDNHVPGNPKKENDVKATCLASGGYDTVTYCSSCKAELERVHTVVDQLDHEYVSVVTRPSCTKDGYTTHTCINGCGDSYTTDPVTALGHNRVTLPTVAPTCSSNGKTAGEKCSVCNLVLVPQTEIYTTVPHTWKAADCNTPKTCKECGKTEGDVKAHSFVNDPDEKAIIVKEVCEGCGLEGKFVKVQIPPAYKDTVVKVVVVTLCALVIIFATKRLMAPPSTTPWWKRRKH